MVLFGTTLSASSPTPAPEESRRCDRNRRRSKRRAIYCLEHRCLMDSVSPKHPLYAVSVAQLRQSGIPRKQALTLMSSHETIPLFDQWIECFWCPQCQRREWYHVRKLERSYLVSIAPPELWQRATGTINPDGNPSVGEFTRRQARQTNGRKFYQ